MNSSNRSRWFILIIANVLFCCVLSFCRTTSASPRPIGLPMAESVGLNAEVVKQLRAIRTLLQEQNVLLSNMTDGATEPQENQR